MAFSRRNLIVQILISRNIVSGIKLINIVLEKVTISAGDMVGFRGGLIESSEAATLKKCVLQNFAELTGKYLCQSLFFDKVSFYISVRVSFLIKLQVEALAHVLS